MNKLSLVTMQKNIQDKADSLVETLTKISEYAGETIVIKFGGKLIDNPEILESFAYDLVALKQSNINVIVVHGGTAKVNSMLSKFDVNTTNIEGITIKDQSTVEIVEMVMSGLISKKIVTSITKIGGTAISLSGKDSGMVIAKRVRKTQTYPRSNIKKILDIGFMGEIVEINPDILFAMEDDNIIPIISPLAIGENGETFQVNSDQLAADIALTLNAIKLILVTDNNDLIAQKKNYNVNSSNIKSLIRNKNITADLISKINICINTVKINIEKCHIIDSQIPHSLLLEVLSNEKMGIVISRDL